MKRGYCGIGIWNPEKECNVGTLFRSALAFGADYVFTVGKRYRRQASDTPNTICNLPYYNFLNIDEFLASRPLRSRIVVVEIEEKSRSLSRFIHPERAIYLLGSEGGNLPRRLIEENMCVKIDTSICLNVATAGSIVLYDRNTKINGNH